MDNFDKIQSKVFKAWVVMFAFYGLVFVGFIWFAVWAINKFTS